MIKYKINKKDISKLEKKINKIDLNLIQDLTKELGITASLISLKAKRDAPVDTGNLKNSINFRKDSKGVYVESPAEYSAFQEYGTKFMKAQPFFFDNAKTEIKILIKRLQNKIKRLV